MIEASQEQYIRNHFLHSLTKTKEFRSYLQNGFFNHTFFIWVSDLIRVSSIVVLLIDKATLLRGKEKTFKQDMHYELRDQESSQRNFMRLQKLYNKVKSHSNRPLVRALYNAYKCNTAIEDRTYNPN